MKVRYFLIDGDYQLRKVSQAAIRDLWQGERRAHGAGPAPVSELRLVSVLCDDRLLPKKLFLLRLPLTDGWFTIENRLTVEAFCRRDCVTAAEAFSHHGHGWPKNLPSQLAIALDVPVCSLEVPLDIGGPFARTAPAAASFSRSPHG